MFGVLKKLGRAVTTLFDRSRDDCACVRVDLGRDGWKRYPKDVITLIQDAYVAGYHEVKFSIRRHGKLNTYILDFATMHQTSTRTGKKRRIKFVGLSQKDGECVDTLEGTLANEEREKDPMAKFKHGDRDLGDMSKEISHKQPGMMGQMMGNYDVAPESFSNNNAWTGNEERGVVDVL